MSSASDVLVQRDDFQKVTHAMFEDAGLASKIAIMIDTGFFQMKKRGPAGGEKFNSGKVFPKCERHHGRLSLKNLDFLFRQLGLHSDICDLLVTKVRLMGCRWLWCWLMDVDMTDKLAEGATTAHGLHTWAKQRQDPAEMRTQILDILQPQHGESQLELSDFFLE